VKCNGWLAQPSTFLFATEAWGVCNSRTGNVVNHNIPISGAVPIKSSRGSAGGSSRCGSWSVQPTFAGATRSRDTGRIARIGRGRRFWWTVWRQFTPLLKPYRRRHAGKQRRNLRERSFANTASSSEIPRKSNRERLRVISSDRRLWRSCVNDCTQSGGRERRVPVQASTNSEVVRADNDVGWWSSVRLRPSIPLRGSTRRRSRRSQARRQTIGR